MARFIRYAVFYAPPEASALEQFGASWLGRDAGGRTVARPSIDGLDGDAIVQATREPTRYGFHGTLKAPFRLADGATVDRLATEIADQAATLAPVRGGRLALETIGRFLALCPSGDQSAINDLAAKLVRALDPHCGPLTDAEVERRQPQRLTDRQRAHLDRWGYPYVLDQFRFHLSLTGPLEPDDQVRFRTALAALVGPITGERFAINEISLFGDPGDGVRFELIARYKLAGRTQSGRPAAAGT